MKYLVIGSMLGIVLLAACGGSASPSLVATAALASTSPAAKPSTAASEAAKPAASAAASAKPSGPATFNIGDTVKMGDLQMVVTKVDAPVTPANQFEKPKNGQFMVVNVQLSNTGTKAANISSMLNFELRDDTGQSYTETILTSAPKPPDGTVAPNDKLAGGLSFDVPTGKSYRLYFKDAAFSTGQAIIELGKH